VHLDAETDRVCGRRRLISLVFASLEPHSVPHLRSVFLPKPDIRKVTLSARRHMWRIAPGQLRDDARHSGGYFRLHCRGRLQVLTYLSSTTQVLPKKVFTGSPRNGEVENRAARSR
jgi:hypothetical protein